jgi:superfamily II DNA or RNA helicase
MPGCAAGALPHPMPDFSIPADFDFGQQFDFPTLQRAMALEPERAVLSMHVEGPVLHARLHGSGVAAYEQNIELPVDRRLGLRVQGHCTCPVGFNCKHVAAALMAFEAHQIRRQKNPAAAADPRITVGVAPRAPAAPLPAPPPPRPTAPELPGPLLAWLGELAQLPALPEAADATAVAEAAPPAETKPPVKQLMYVLCAQGTQLQLRIHLGSLRRNGEVGSHHAHSPSVADMLRNQPAYLTEPDLVALAALLPLALQTVTSHIVIAGRHAGAALRALVATGRVWLLRHAGDMLPMPAGPPARWLDEPLPLTLQWQADTMGQWRTHWRGPEGQTPALVLLPEPHALDAQAQTLQPALLAEAQFAGPLPDQVIDWLSRMPAVPAQALPQLIDRLQRSTAAKRIRVPLPQPAPQQQGGDLGALALVPVLRLSTCVDVSSEAMLHYRYGSAASRNTTLRQASAQVLLRYLPPGAAAVEFHVPAVVTSTPQSAFVELPEVAVPDGVPHTLARFERNGAAESAALRHLFTELEFRPWSLAAGLVLNRLTRVNTGRLQDSAIPPAAEGQPLVLVPQRRDQWPELLAVHLPALQARGWVVEVADDFPFELHNPDEWALEIDEEAGAEPGRSDWFKVGLKVSVDGKPVDLVPLLVSLVQTGWMKLDAALREHAEVKDAANLASASASDAPADAATGSPSSSDAAPANDGHVLVPWPSDAVPLPGRPTRQRLLRLPVARIAPLMDWLRAVFKAGDKGVPLRVSRFDLGTLDALSSGAAVSAPPSFTELIEQLHRLQGGNGLPAVDASPNVNAVLRHYQQDGLAWMDFMRRARLGGVLADDMGLGKTLQALALLQGELDAGRLDRPSLVVVPTSLLGNWHAEAQRFTPGLKVLVLHGPRRTLQFGQIAQADLVVTSYPLAVRDIATLAATDWHYLVLDEAQRIKNSRSQAALSLKGLRARHRLCLSGTPLENHLGELWSLMDFVCPGLLGSEAQFREHYRNPIEKRQDALQAEHLARRIRPFILRRTKSQVAQELPEKTETLLRVELAGTQADLYETVRATMDEKLREAIAKQGLARSQIMVLDALLKLRQVCCDPRLLKTAVPQEEGDAAEAEPAEPAHHAALREHAGARAGAGARAEAGALAGAPGSTRGSAHAGAHGGAATAGKHAPSAKMELLLDLLPTLVEDGRRVLLFSQFTEMLALIEPELARLKLPYLKLTGDTPNRTELVAQFQQGDVPLFLISLKAGGVGLNLTAADTVILYDPWWNPAVEQQAIDRAYRIGQDKPVFVYKLLASGTVEDKMLELQARKAGLADQLLSGVASDAALNAQDFDELFRPLAEG